MKFFRSITLPIAGIATMAMLSGCGDSANITGPDPVLDTTPPPAPSDLHFASVSGQMVLTWSPSAAPDVAGYEVYVYGEGNGVIEAIDANSADNLYQIPAGPESGTSIYRVRAVDTSGNASALSESVEFNGGFTPLEIEE